MGREKSLDELEKEIDFDAVIARMSGEPLTEEQEESCRKFDVVYGYAHQEKKRKKS